MRLSRNLLSQVCTIAGMTLAGPWLSPGTCQEASAGGQAAPSVSGTGNVGRVAVWKNSTTMGNSALFQSSANVGIGSTAPGSKLDVAVDINWSGRIRHQGIPVLQTLGGNSSFSAGPSALSNRRSTLLAMVGCCFGVSSAMAGTIAACAADDPVAPGNTDFPIDCTGSTSGTLLASMSEPFTYTTSAGTNSGFISSAVYDDGGTLNFYYQLANNASSATSFSTLSANSFAGFTTNDAYIDNGSSLGTVFVDGSNQPLTVANSPDGITTEFYFGAGNPLNDIAPGSQSVVLIISTNATAFTAGNATVIDSGGGTFTVASFQPRAYTFTNIDFPGATGTSALGINDAGQIVGYYEASDGTSHGFLLSGGTFTTIDDPGLPGVLPIGINNSGTIVGSCVGTCSSNQGYTLKYGKFTTITYPGATKTLISGINNKDVIIGYYVNSSDEAFNFLYHDSTFSSVPPLPDGGFASFINDIDQIDGSYNAGGFLLKPSGSVTMFSYPPSTVVGGVFGMNNLGQIVGLYELVNSGPEYGFMWSQGTLTAITPPNSISTEPMAINNSGAIVGAFIDTTVAGHGFLATPNKSPGPACGVYDISSETSVLQGQLNPIPSDDMLFSQTDTVTNKGSKVIPSAYLVLHGQPTATTGLVGNQLVTYCFSTTGDYILPIGTIPPGKAGGYEMLWSAPNPFISYTTSVLNGFPNK